MATVKAKKKKSKKGLLIILAILFVVISGTVIAILIHNSKTASSIEGVTYTVKSETYENKIDVSGYIDAAETQTLYVASDATVTSVNVSEGDIVKAGDILVQLTNYEEKYGVSEEEYNIEKAQVSGSLKEVALMQKKLEMLKEDLKDKQIIATYNGIVAELDASVGDYYEAANTVGTLINREYLTADMEVVETDMSKLKVGQKVVLEFPAYPDEEIVGYVYSWPAIATISNSGSTVVEVEMRVYDAPDEILPNYSFTGEIEVSEAQDVLIVERYSIGHDNEMESFVEVIGKENTITKTAVEIESYGTNYVKILSGVDIDAVLKAQTENSSGSEVGEEGVMGLMGGNSAPPSGGRP